MTSSALLIATGLGLGLIVGSFLNVVIHRLPRMMERQWAQELAQWQAQQKVCGPASQALPAEGVHAHPYHLARPGSHCPSCGHALAWHENIPLLSFVFLRGRCAACSAAISWRYPAVELATAGLFAWCFWRWGFSPAGWLWCGFSGSLLTLACIDWDTQLLPDDITLPLLWSGLVAAALGWNPWTGLHDAVWGAAGGYLCLWLVYHLFKGVTGQEGMGHGDFKLLAALGAWFGWAALLPVVLVASFAGAAVGLSLRGLGRLQAGQPMPFGPFLALAGFLAMLLGPDYWWPYL